MLVAEGVRTIDHAKTLEGRQNSDAYGTAAGGLVAHRCSRGGTVKVVGCSR